MAKVTKSDVISALPATVKERVEILTPEEVGFPHLLHISHNLSISKFIPMVSTRAMSIENKSVARVCVAATIGSCIAGHSATDHIHLNGCEGFNGLWQVYGFDYRFAVKPKPSLLPDVNQTKELWLTEFDDESSVYKPLKLAQFFYRSITYKRVRNLIEFELFFNVTGDIEVALDDTLKLTKGKWLVTASMERKGKATWSSYSPLKILSVGQIDKLDFDEEAKQVVTLEHEGPTLSLNW